MNVPNVTVCEFCHEEAAEFIGIEESISRELHCTYICVGRPKLAITLIESELVIADIITAFGLFAILIFLLFHSRLCSTGNRTNKQNDKCQIAKCVAGILMSAIYQPKVTEVLADEQSCEGVSRETVTAWIDEMPSVWLGRRDFIYEIFP